MKSRILFFLILILFACQKNNTITLDEIKILLDEKNYEIAIKKLNGFIKINKNESDAYNLLGICFLEINEFDKAEINFSNNLVNELKEKTVEHLLSEKSFDKKGLRTEKVNSTNLVFMHSFKHSVY